MTRPSIRGCACLAGVILVAGPAPSRAQSSSTRPTGHVSVHVNTPGRDWNDGNKQRDTELSTGVTLRSPRTDENGVEYGLDLRHTRYASGTRPDRLSIYDGFAGGRFGGDTQVRV